MLTRDEFSVEAFVNMMYVDNEVISKYRSVLMYFLKISDATEPECQALQAVLNDMLQQNLSSQLEFGLYDFFENLYSAEKKNNFSVKELVASLEAIKRVTGYLQYLQQPRFEKTHVSNEKKEKYNETLNQLHEFRKVGEDCVKRNFFQLLSQSNTTLNKANISEAIDLLLKRWLYQIDSVNSKQDECFFINTYFNEFARLVSFAHEIFSLRPDYLSKKKSPRFCSWELSIDKQNQLYRIEEAMITALQIGAIDLSYDAIKIMIPVMKQASDVISKNMFGRSALSSAIDAVVSNFDKPLGSSASKISYGKN